MTAHSGPNTIENGLVFAYDMDNPKKSWKGAPTTNLYADGDFSSQTLHPVRSGTWQVVPDPRNQSKKVLKATPSAGNQYHGRDITVAISSVYSLQMEVYVSPDFNGNNVQMYPEQGGSGANITYNLSNKGTWQLLKFNSKSATTTNIRMLAYVLSAFTTGYVLISNVQVELSSFATPFINGTRSNTQAILDWTSNNTITANSLTYNSDGSFSFNGSSDFVTIPSINFSTGQTIEIWLKPTENDANRRNPYNQSYGGYGTWTHEINGAFNYYYGDAGVNGSPYIGHTSNFTVLQNELACVCSTRNLTTSVWYKNGIQGSSYTHSYGELLTDNNPILIGSGYASGYMGNIYAVKLYNRALTATEVQQNFNASRNRFGL